MSMFKLDPEQEAFGSISIENAFFTDYLPSAKGDQVRVYLYGLYRTIYPLPEAGITEMAKELGLEENDVLSALRYWERRGLVSRVRTDPPEYVFSSIAARRLSGKEFSVDDPYVEFTENVYSLFGSRRKISPEEAARAYEWVADIGLPAEVVLMLLSHLISTRGVNFNFRQSEKMAVRMKEENVLTTEDADQFFKEDSRVRDGCRKLLRHMGKRRDATLDEYGLYLKWVKDWGFTEEAILSACREMTRGDPSFAYLDSILDRLHSGNARSSDQIDEILTDEKHKRENMRSVLDTLGLSVTLKAFEPVYDHWLTIYPHPVILLAAAECRMLQTGKAEKTEDMLESWKERRGLRDENEVKAYLETCRSQNKRLRQLFELMGHTGAVTEGDRELLRKWQLSGISDELLDCAAAQSRMANGSKLRYMDSVLEQWKAAGIRTVEDTGAKKPQKAAAGTDKAPAKTLNAQNYTQREYTQQEMDDLQRRIFEEAFQNEDEPSANADQ